MDLTARLNAIIQRTYDEHALGNRPWGVNPEQPAGGGCSYAAGCAIGINLTPETARRIDQLDPDATTIADILDEDETVRFELFGTRAVLPRRACEVLKQVQYEHDRAATLSQTSDADKRASYRRRLRSLAYQVGLTLRTPEAD